MKPPQLAAILAAAFTAAACAQVVEYQYIGTEFIRNEQNHVVGHKELLLDARTGEEVEQITRYRPIVDDTGNVVGYEESVRGGTVIRSLDGRRRGGRYSDLRSRGSNPGNEGLTITVQP